MTNPSDLGEHTFADPRRGIPGDVEYAYRVVEVLAVDDDGRVTSGKVRRFSTPDGAERCRSRLLRAGKSVVLQVGVTHWSTPDEKESDDAV
ncbi:hypothetical protein [Amycolatopsis kentuckyensis]|uniref:hypothetical protein n=1 Tax=Amycolatopsis kentuckyensis TaxID=218823 RepID=UPI0035697FFE